MNLVLIPQMNMVQLDPTRTTAPNYLNGPTSLSAKVFYTVVLLLSGIRYQVPSISKTQDHGYQLVDLCVERDHVTACEPTMAEQL